jgi:hypothetical protein
MHLFYELQTSMRKFLFSFALKICYKNVKLPKFVAIGKRFEKNRLLVMFSVLHLSQKSLSPFSHTGDTGISSFPLVRNLDNTVNNTVICVEAFSFHILILGSCSAGGEADIRCERVFRVPLLHPPVPPGD